MKIVVIVLFITIIPMITSAGEVHFPCADYILAPIYFIGLQIYYLMEELNRWWNDALPGFGGDDKLYKDLEKEVA